MKKYVLKVLFLIVLSSILNAQIYIQADPFYLLKEEKTAFNANKGNYFGIRPFLNDIDSTLIGDWSLKVRTEAFINNNAPNLENTSERWVGRGLSFYQGLKVSYQNKFLLLSFEPFYFINQNKEYAMDWKEYFEALPDSVIDNYENMYDVNFRDDQPFREHKFSRLNDNRPFTDSPYNKSGLREAQLYLHYNGLGVGFSNANMWWGSGYHSSLSMSNNTTGFPHIMIGTIKEQSVKDFGINFRYIFADSLKHNEAMPFLSAIVSSITYYSDPIVTLGFSRMYLTGGRKVPDDITRKDAMLIPFEALFLKDKVVDIWDQTLIGYFTMSFPKSGLVVYIEYGRNDHAWNREDFLRQPDHTGASIIGLRKYGLFGNSNFVFGLEYANLIKTKFWDDRPNADWYDRWNFDYWSYNGRHWGAHSGPDSDDFYIFFGYLGTNFSVIPSFNYERHGVIDNMIPEREYSYIDEWLKFGGTYDDWSEVKLEYKLDLRYSKWGFDFNLLYEYENIHNDQFRGYASEVFKERNSHVFWLGVERNFNTSDLKNLYNDIIRK